MKIAPPNTAIFTTALFLSALAPVAADLQAPASAEIVSDLEHFAAVDAFSPFLQLLGSQGGILQTGGTILFDFANDIVGSPPSSFIPVIGHWLIGGDGKSHFLIIDGQKWCKAQSASDLAESAEILYGDHYAEFLDSMKILAYFPHAIATGIEDFREGEISLKFEAVGGKVDQAAGILFNLKPNGNYYVVRANPLESNLVLWKFEKGARTSLVWIAKTPTAGNVWHDLKLILKGQQLEAVLDGTYTLKFTMPEPASGKIGVWSKADSVVYFNDFRVTPAEY